MVFSPQVFQAFVQPHAVPGQALAAFAEAFRVPAGQGVHILRRAAEEDHPPAAVPEGFQRFQRRAAHRLASGHNHHVIGHFADGELFLFPFPDQLRQRGFADIIKVQRILQQPARNLIEAAVQLCPLQAGPVVRAVGDPAGFHRVDYADADPRFPAGHQGVHPGKVILDERVFPPPGALVPDGGGIVALGFPVHGAPVQVRHAHGHTQGGLPVALQLVSLEVEVPVRHPVQLAGHAGASLLVRGGSRLLHGQELTPVAQHVHPGQREGAIGAHTLTHGAGLGFQGSLFHHMAGHQDAVLPAPVADLVAEGGYKPLG